MTTVELVEHARPTPWTLDTAIGQALATSKIVDAAPDPYTPGVWLLRAGSKVGAVTVTAPGADPVSVQITPKVSIARLLFLLGYATDSKGWRNDTVDVQQYADLLPALAHAFERQVERALRQGLIQGYRTIEDTALVVRGRIREADQIRRRFGAAIPVELRYDEFTADTPENQILRAAVERLLRLPGVPPLVSRRLLHHKARLADVSPLVRGVPLPAWRATRLNARYHQALHLARAVLRDSSVEHRAGDLRISCFLFDMNRLFEDFVTVALREALTSRHPGGRTVLQARHHLDEANTIRIRPDLVLYGPDDLPRAVVDAKYKAEKPDGFPEADLYQMLAYCTALGLGEGHLVYAKGNAPHAVHQVRGSGIVLHQYALDLDQPPTALLAEVADLADAVSAVAGSSL
ncbi:McrC family protein [Kitasatospora sp. NPDC059463]|uniref:McrC family protein n=1 Tax=unclassified Kitasatospora TaxID=2633591 RepID=UPI0036B283D4